MQGVVMTFSTDSQRRLIWHGMFLFLLGLLIGFAEGQVINPVWQFVNPCPCGSGKKYKLCCWQQAI
jgi:hypothetical protein